MTVFQLVAIDSLAWAVVQPGLARAFVCIGPDHVPDLAVHDTSDSEIGVYRALGIRRWKAWLPDGARWVGSRFSKSGPTRWDTEYLQQFEIETRRAELAHWVMISALPIFFLWNPVRAWPMLALYSGLSNLPCILAQRYNRHILRRLVGKRIQLQTAGQRLCAVE